MPDIEVDGLIFNFPDNWRMSKLDEWSFYRRQFQNVCGGAKAVDLLALENRQCAWFIEAKDYRNHRRTKTIEIADEVACKVRDSLAGLVAAHINADDPDQREQANSAFHANRIRVVLHLEQPAKHSKMFPRVIEPSKVKQKLKQLIKAIDPHPLVLEMNRMGNVAWTVT